MNYSYFISFNKSDQDVPVLTVFEKNGFLEPVVKVAKVFTGDEATYLYNKLTKNTISSMEFKHD